MMCGTTNLSARLASAIVETMVGGVPEKSDRATRRALLDALGVMLAATGLAPEAAPYHRRALAAGGGVARLLGGGCADPSLAALANGALAHALDYGDTYDAGPAHPNAALVPALLALVDAVPGIRLQQLIRAMAAGSDLACRLSRAPARPYEDGGWYPPPLFGAVAAAAGCAALLGLGRQGVVAAMGLAMCGAAFPGEIKHDPASGLRAVREGFAARAAVDAALLAQAGAGSFAAPLEGPGGFFALYGGGGWRDDVLMEGLGARFLGAEVSFKPWPSCRGTHPYIEAALALRDGLDLTAIERIEAETGPVQAMLIAPHADKVAPSNAIGAKFSIPYTVACALVDGAVTLDSFAEGRLRATDLAAVAARVVDRPNPDWTRAEAASGGLTLVLTDGTRHERRVMQSLGHPDRPLSDAALVAKFVDCAGRSVHPLSRPQAEALAHLILDGPDALPARQLMDACTPAVVA